MAKDNAWVSGETVPRAATDESSSTAAEVSHSRNYVWDTNLLQWVRETQPSGGSGGGGGAVTIADGANVAQGTTTDASGANTVIGKLKQIAASLAGTLTVATHAVTQSGSWTADVTDRAARLVGHVTVDSAPTTAVTGTFFQSTQPVSLATNTPDVTDRSGRLLGTIANTAFTANAGTNLNTSALALDATLTGGTQKAIARTAAKGTAVAADLTSNPIDANTQALHVDGSKVTQPVSGTFFQATQPVSLATNTPDVTDRAARLLGHVTVDSAPTTAVTGTFWQATQPVSLAAETTKVIGVVRTADGSGNLTAVKAASTLALATDPSLIVQQTPQRPDAASLCVTATAATGVAATLSLPAAGAGLFHYISLIEIQLYATAARTGGATPVLVTTTNLPGSPVWDFDTAQAIGVTIRQSTQPATPIKSSVANTATTIVAPIATTGIWRITAYYYTAP